jgi:hypothetical protein
LLVKNVSPALVLDPIEGMVYGAAGTPTGQWDDDDNELTSVGNPSQESFCSLFYPGEESEPAD